MATRFSSAIRLSFLFSRMGALFSILSIAMGFGDSVRRTDFKPPRESVHRRWG